MPPIDTFGPLARRWQQAGLLAGTALLLSVLEVGQVSLRSTIGGPAVRPLEALGYALPFWAALAVLMPLPVWMVRRYPLASGTSANLARHAAAAAIFAFAHAALAAAVNSARAGGSVPFGALVSKALSFAVVIDLLFYLAIVGAVHAAAYYAESRQRERQAAELQASLAEARLQALRAQIDPHVLFNTLNAVSVLALKGDHDAVVRVVGLLSELLRACLDESRGQESALAEELRIVDCYLAIQQTRFGNRLVVERDVDATVLDALVPTMVLQPLVENAITHGVTTAAAGGRVRIAARREGDALALTVTDTGPGFGASPANGRGLGLSNTRARLAQLYGPGHSLTTGPAAGGGARVHLTLPLHRAAGQETR
jgi:two-component system LytT family sensor kinase